ncbi:MAG: hypothetical protein BGP06_21145 [Rhizobiales bacterium 65-9]|nr:DUF2125 domain-containing protein [Hyphomicrobiales bacterium]OJY36520.1 MAG: hypothetical protein BGP06_21145 [Rhizobiales bacterium 65-9]
MADKRKSILAPPLLLLAVIVLWSGYWFVGSHIAGTAIANWVTRENDNGRRWTCHDQRIGGFPFRFELNCSSVSIEEGRITASAGPLRAVALAYKPNHVVAELDGPAQATLPSGQSFNVTWLLLRTSAVLSGGRLERYDSVIEGFKATQAGAQESAVVAQAANLETHLRVTPDSPPETPSFDVAIDGKGVASPLIDALVGSNDPGDLMVRATMTRADTIGAGHPVDNIERWRLAGGKLSIAQMKATRGRIALDARGELAIDDQHMIAGRVEGSAAGIDQILGRSGGLLSGLVNLGAPAQGLPFALTFRDGRVMMGPIRLLNLQPLY